MTIDTAPWTIRVDLRVAPRDTSRQQRTATVVMVAGLVVGLGALVAILVRVVEGVGNAGLAVVVVADIMTAFVAFAIRARHRGLGRLAGDDRIVAVVADEGVVLQGGLPLVWTEITRVAITRMRRTGGGGADAISRGILQTQGISNVWTTVDLWIGDWAAVDARATTKQLRRHLERPILRMSASARMDLALLAEPEVQQVLGALMAQARRRGIAVTTG